jgi:hypothetical protein
MDASEECPFKPGDVVVYRPSQRGWDVEVMSERLVRGKEYIVTEIQNGAYVVVEGYKHPGGGLYWTEFQPRVKMPQ